MSDRECGRRIGALVSVLVGGLCLFRSEHFRQTGRNQLELDTHLRVEHS